MDNPKSDHQRFLSAIERYRFDPEGFSLGKPLKKRIFYSEPYMTCSHCNTIYFLDITQLKFLTLINGEDLSIIPPEGLQDELISTDNKEKLPPCRTCNRADGYRCGAHDFEKDIENQKKLNEQREINRNRAASIIGKFYRRYLFRLYGKSVREALIAMKLLRHKAAVLIGSIVRGRLARRRYVTEQHLRKIRKSHELLLKYALRTPPGQPRVFWYYRSVELKLLYSNYLELVEKTGYQPVRKIVEENIRIISERILKRKNELITLIQRRWRGFLSRRIVRYFRTEIYRMFSRLVAKAIRIQCVFRGHRIRLWIERMKIERKNEEIKIQYLKSRHDSLILEKQSRSKEQFFNYYRNERQVEKTTRMLDKVQFALEDLQGRTIDNRPITPATTKDKLFRYLINIDNSRDLGKMNVFQNSIYGDDIISNLGLDILDQEYILLNDEKREILEDVYRREFIEMRIRERGPLGYGKRSEPIEHVSLSKMIFSTDMEKDQRKQNLSKRSKEKNITCPRSLYMKWYFEDNLRQISNRIIDRMSTARRPQDILKITSDYKEMKQNNKDLDPSTLLKGTSHSFSINNDIPLVEEVGDYDNDLDEDCDDPNHPGNNKSREAFYSSSSFFPKKEKKLTTEFKTFNKDKLALLNPIIPEKKHKKKSFRPENNKSSSQLIDQPPPVPQRRLSSHLRHFKYPDDINFKSIDWLYKEDYDNL